MSDFNIINAIYVPDDEEQSNSRAASNLRDVADRVEAGEIKSVMALALTHDEDIDLIIRFKSRLEFMGALQYTQSKLGSES